MSHWSVSVRFPVRLLLLAALLAAAWVVVSASGAQASDRPEAARDNAQTSRPVEHHAPLESLTGGTERLRSELGRAVKGKVVEPLDRTAKGLAGRVVPSTRDRDASAESSLGAPSSAQPAAHGAIRTHHSDAAAETKSVEHQGDSKTSQATESKPLASPRHEVNDVKRNASQAVPARPWVSAQEPTDRRSSERTHGPLEKTSTAPTSEPTRARAPEKSSDANHVGNKAGSTKLVSHVVNGVDRVLGKTVHDVRTVTRSLPTAAVTESPLGAGVQDVLQQTVTGTTTVTRHVASTVDHQLTTTAGQVDSVLRQAPVVPRLLGDRPVSTALEQSDHAVTSVLDPVTQATGSAVVRTSNGSSLSISGRTSPGWCLWLAVAALACGVAATAVHLAAERHPGRTGDLAG